MAIRGEVIEVVQEEEVVILPIPSWVSSGLTSKPMTAEQAVFAAIGFISELMEKAGLKISLSRR